MVLLLWLAIPTHAETYTWTGAASSEWNNPANWIPATGVPSASDTAIINSGASVVSSDTTVARLELNGGSLRGTGTLTVATALAWSGASSMQGGGATVIGPGATATLTGDGDRELRERALINWGTVVCSATGRLVFWDGAVFENEGLADLQRDVTWVDGVGSGPSRLVNRGTLRKTGGEGTWALQSPRLLNVGRCEVLSGTLELASGVAGGGIFHAASTTQIRYRDLAQLTNVTFSGPGLQRMEAGAVLEGAVIAENLEWVAGTIRGTHTLGGRVVWSGGGLSGVGTTTIAPGGVLRLVGYDDHNLRGHAIIVQGRIEHVAGGRLVFWDEARFENATQGVVELQGDAIWVDGGGTGPSALINAGTIRKQGGEGTSTFQNLAFENSGLLELATGRIRMDGGRFDNAGEARVSSGELTLGGGGASSGRWVTLATAQVVFESGDSTLEAGARLEGPGLYRIRSGTVAINGQMEVSLIELLGGVLAGMGTLTVTKEFAWPAASTMRGGGTTVIGPKAVAFLSGNGDRHLQGRTLINQGTIAHSGPCRLVFWNSSRLENASGGLVDLQGDVKWIDGVGSGPSTLVNAGALRKSAGGGMATIQNLRPLNTGTCEALSGTLELQNGVEGGGILHAAAGMQIRYGGLIALTNVVFSGAGVHQVQAGAVLEGSVSAENLEWVGGALQGTHTFTGNLVWLGGELSGSGVSTVGPEGRLQLAGSGDRTLRGRTLLIQGKVEHVGDCRFVFWDQSRFENAAGGVVDLQSDATWVDGGGTGPSSLTNRGTFRKSAGTGISSLQNLAFDNPGLLEAAEGSIRMEGGRFDNRGEARVNRGELIHLGEGANFGRWVAAEATSVIFGSGSPTLEAGARLDGLGTYRVLGATLTVNSPVEVGRLQLNSGMLTGTGTLTVTQALAWSGNCPMLGEGTTVIGPGATATLSGDGDRSLRSWGLVNRGTLVHPGPCRVVFWDQSRFENAAGGVVDLQSDATWVDGGGTGTSSLTNHGTFRKSSGTGISSLQNLAFNNPGVLEVTTGTIQMDNSPFSNSGEARVSNGQLIHRGGGSSSGRWVASDTGAVTFAAGFPSLEAGARLEGLGTNRIAGATVAVNGPVGVDRLELNAGTVTGAGVLTVANLLVWSGGGSSMREGGTTVLGPEAVATLSGTGDREVRARTFINQGTLTQLGSCRVVFWDQSRFENAASGVVDLQSDATWIDGGGTGPSSLTNHGTFRKSSGTGISSLQNLAFNNPGVLEVTTGTIQMDNSPFSNSGEARVDNGELIHRGGGSSSGRWVASDTATVVFASGFPSLEAGTRLEGLGMYRITGATLAVNGPVGADRLELNAGMVTGAGTLTVTNVLAWSGNCPMQGEGATVIGPGATATLSGDGDRSLRSWGLVNRGTLVHSDPCRVVFWDQSRFENAAGGVVDLRSDATWVDGGGTGPSSLANHGTFRKSSGTGISVLQSLTFNNEGILAAWQGTLQFGVAPTLGSSTAFEFGLAGTTFPDGYGRIACGQSLSLVGRLAVLFRNGFVPGPGQQFEVIGAPVQGVFQNYTAPPISATVFINPVYRANGVSLVTTDPTPTIRGLPRPNAEQQIHLSIQGIANLSYVVLASTDFEDWTPLATNAVPASTIWEFVDVDSAELPMRFYRVFYQP